ncbi:MAG: hypothetical protein ACKO4S_19185, partial [Snowella sp.]
ITQEVVNKGEKVCFITTENANLLPNPEGINLKTTKNNLTREEYLEWLCLSDIILLPYHADAYKERTSGIFTECIIAGKIPLVTPNTWMAQELKNYQLEDLIIDWDNAQKVCDRIISLMANPSIHNQIMIMQKDFKQFHNLENYAQTMQDIFDKT